MSRGIHFGVGKMSLVVLIVAFVSLTGCGQNQSSGGADYSEDLQNIADAVGASQKTQTSATSRGTSTSSVSSSSVMPLTHTQTPDADGWITYTDTFEYGGVTTTQTTRMRYSEEGNRLNAEITGESSRWNTSANFQMTGLAQTNQLFLQPPQTATEASIQLTGNAKITYSNGFELLIDSLAVSFVYSFPGGGSLANLQTTANATVAWSADNGLYTGTLSAQNITEQTPTITGDVYRSGQRVGTISMNNNTGDVTITDANGKVIRSS